MKISIITINYNDLDGLKKTIESVTDQIYENIEYIVIDGGSKDGSTEYIESNSEKFSYWTSEPDQGIYDAMNKGIDQASGDYLLFLNSGDFLVDPTVIQRFVEQEPNEDIVYGDIWITGRSPEPFYRSMPDILGTRTLLTFTITHQAIFHKKSLFDIEQYNVNYSIIADWVFMNNAIILNNASYRHLNFPIAIYEGTGFSSKFREKREQERSIYFKEIAPFVIEDLVYEKITPNLDFGRFSFLIRALMKLDRVSKRYGF